MHPTFTVHALQRWEEKIKNKSFVDAWLRSVPYGVETKTSRYKLDDQTGCVFVIEKKRNVVKTILTREQYVVYVQKTFGTKTFSRFKPVMPVMKRARAKPPSEKETRGLIQEEIDNYMQKFVIGTGRVNVDNQVEEIKKVIKDILRNRGYDITKPYVGEIINAAIKKEQVRTSFKE